MDGNAGCPTLRKICELILLASSNNGWSASLKASLHKKYFFQKVMKNNFLNINFE